ncbi:RING-H2 finger protein ATL60-like [Cucumis melo var. makuwa]|uniref:RING-type E3 ubiquitin transferase n=2 Tax=Cucumis melo TaxID=3656 RepID=A0A5D3BW46_CUCMM|nr:RING-H2 finger protein ATL60-like [Cucumis melo var. makuwa]TYK03973.1 RING-H2 finger protein ATL60-like [Cucumis melo var. makuwa]
MEAQASTINHPFGDSFAMQLTGKIMFAAILILCLVIAFVLLLQLYSRWFLSRLHQSSSDSATNQESPVSTTLRKGLDSAVLHSIPVVVFSPADFKEGLECAVCLSELSEGEKARLLPRCNHGFHVDCIDMWFKSNSTCPLCRNPVAITEPNLEQNPETESSTESPIFPTNVLFWGNQMQVSSRGVCLEEPQISSSSSSSPSSPSSANAMVVIDIPSQPSTSGASTCFADEEMGSVVTNRLRTLKRLLSRERRIGNNPISSDIEQEGIGQS